MLFTLKRFDIFENVEICRKLTFEWLFDNLVNLDFWLFDNLLKFKFVTYLILPTFIPNTYFANWFLHSVHLVGSRFIIGSPKKT